MSKKKVLIQLVAMFFDQKRKSLFFADALHNDWVDVLNRGSMAMWKSKTDGNVGGMVGGTRFKGDGFCFGVFDPTNDLHLLNLMSVLKNNFLSEFSAYEQRIGKQLLIAEYNHQLSKVALKNNLQTMVVDLFDPNAEGVKRLVDKICDWANTQRDL